MTKTLYKLAFFISFISLLIMVVSGKTLYTSITRGVVVYIGVLVTIFIIGNLLKLGMSLTIQRPSNDNKQ